MTPPATPAPSSLYIAWKSECFRSTQTAHVLGCPLALIKPVSGSGRLRTVWRYVVSAVVTAGVLARRRPRRLAILNQPMPLAAVAGLYARLTGAALILDCHSKAYDDDLFWLEKAPYPALTRLARLNINHNEQDAAVARRWGGRSLIIKALPFVLPVTLSPPTPAESPFVLCVCSFAPDEPIAVILEAARRLPHLRIRMTGDPRKAGLTAADLPPNLELTGYLKTQDYYDAMAQAAAVLTLSTRPYIMQMAAEEAMVVGVPVVTNRSPTLESVLGDGGVFVDIEAADLVRGLSEALERGAELRERIAAARVRVQADVTARLDPERVWG